MIPKLDEYKLKWDIKSDDSVQLGLNAIEDALHKLNNPHKQLKVVHVAGTNGKGSTITFLEQIARSHHFTVGKFMSPCVVDVHDQIQINGTPIEAEQLDFVFKRMKEAGLSGMLTDFELLTCAAFLHFAEQKVELVLVETGMGGRDDSTNVVFPMVSIIPSIALEHTNFLGHTIAEIAEHKAGIIKEKKPIIVGNLPEDAHHVIVQKAKQNKAPLKVIGRDFTIQETDHGEIYQYPEKGLKIEGLKRSLLGKHQGDNLALAITAFVEIAEMAHRDIEPELVRGAVLQAKLPSRFEEVLPNVYFDGAHNPASVEKLVDTIRDQFRGIPIRFVVGIVADKEAKTILQQLESVSDEFYFVNFSNRRAMKAKDLITFSKATKKEIIDDVFPFLKESTKRKGMTIVTGSLYLLAEIRKQLIDSII